MVFAIIVKFVRSLVGVLCVRTCLFTPRRSAWASTDRCVSLLGAVAQAAQCVRDESRRNEQRRKNGESNSKGRTENRTPKEERRIEQRTKNGESNSERRTEERTEPPSSVPHAAPQAAVAPRAGPGWVCCVEGWRVGVGWGVTRPPAGLRKRSGRPLWGWRRTLSSASCW